MDEKKMTRKEFADATHELEMREGELRAVGKVYDDLTNDAYTTVGVTLLGVTLSLYSDDIISALISKRNALIEHINKLYDMFGIMYNTLGIKEAEDEKAKEEDEE